MHSYLRAIGLGCIKKMDELDKVLNQIINESSIKIIAKLSEDTSVAEYSMEYADNIGLTVRGEIDTEGKLHYEHFFPYLRGTNVSCNEEIFVNKRVDTDAYTGMCDDFRLGVSLIFYIQNKAEYVNYASTHNGPLIFPVMLSALGLAGKILLPTEHVESMDSIRTKEAVKKSKLIAEAKKGNQEAIESLTINDIDNYAQILQRIKNEDLFSIVETSFVPFGSESDIYNIVGVIADCKRVENSMTKEALWVFQLVCNQVAFDLCINEEDLVGEPEAGRRFRGTIWLQGYIDFAG